MGDDLGAAVVTGWLFDPETARATALAYRMVSPLVGDTGPLDGVLAAETLTPDAGAVLAALQSLRAEAASLHQDLLDHARELLDVAVLVERHESLVTHLMRDAEDAALGHLLGRLHLPVAEGVLRWLGGGHPLVHLSTADAGPEWSLGARSLADWLARGDRLADGDFAVSLLADGVVVVVLPGIHSLGDAPDTRDLPGAARELATGSSAYHEAVVKALQGMSLPPAARIAIIGHSQGGIVAMDLARDPRITALGTVTQVVTAGSPVDGIRVPGPTRVLELVNPDDAVPQLDGRRPVTHAGQVVVTGTHGAVGPSHAMAG